MIKISVIMPAYNAEPYIGEAIQSILNQQNCPRFELLVVDDGSTDGTAKVVRSFKSRRIVLLQKEHNGIVDALNLGLTQAKGKYIARMDADDTCAPERLGIQYRFMEAHPEVDVLGTGMEWSTGGTFSRDGELTKEHLLQGNGMVHASVMMRRESLLRLPVVYENGYLHGEDYQLWLKMATNGFRLWNIPNVLYFYRQHQTQVSKLFAQEEWDVGERLRAMYAVHTTPEPLLCDGVSGLFTPEVTCIIPTYNDGEYLTDSIQSVLSQTHSNIEVLVVDDGSTDNTAELVGAIADKRVRYFKLPHVNANVARNHGIKNARGKYVAFLDADDLWDANHLEICLQTIAYKKCDGVYSGMKREQKDGSYRRCACAGPKNGEPFVNYLLRTGCGSSTNGLVMTTESALNVLWDESMLRHQDYDFAVRYANRYRFELTNAHTFYYLRRPKKSRTIDFRSCIKFIEHNRQDIEPAVLQRYLDRMRAMAIARKSGPDIIGWYDNELAALDAATCTSFCTESEIKDELTAIIPFCNEGEEVERTVASIRRTTTSISILLINDAATDGYDYERVAKQYGCRYYQNDENCGVAMSRNIGVVLCQTPYFVLLDGHMRFYDAGWETRLLDVLKANPGCLVTSNTVPFHKDANGVYDDKESLTECPPTYGTHGAYLNMDEPGWEFTAKWAKKSEELRVKS